MKLRTRRLRRLGNADDKLQRMDMAGAGIAHAAMKPFRADPLGRLRRIHEGHMRIVVAAGGDLDAVFVVALMARLVGDVHLAGHVFDIDAVLGGKILHVSFGAFGKVEKGSRRFVAELFLHLFRRPALAGAHLAAIAARGTVAEAGAVDQNDRDA